MEQAYVVRGCRWVSGVSTQSWTTVGPVYGEANAEKLAAQLEEMGYGEQVEVEVYELESASDWRKRMSAERSRG